jgi:hypothetical protein
LRFNDPTALAQPFPTQTRLLKEQTRTTVNFRRDQGGATKETEKYPIALEGFDVGSNSQAMLHSEHMLDLKGTLHLKPLAGGGMQVVNDTHLKLQGVGVISPEGLAWVGTLEPGASAKLNFELSLEPTTEAESSEVSRVVPTGLDAEILKETAELEVTRETLAAVQQQLSSADQGKLRGQQRELQIRLAAIKERLRVLEEKRNVASGMQSQTLAKVIERPEPWHNERDQSPVTASRYPPEVLNIRQLVRLAQNTVRPGEIRLVAWIDDELPGQRIEPAASQIRQTHVIVAHLKPPSEPPPKPDLNTHLEIKAADFEPEKNESNE